MEKESSASTANLTKDGQGGAAASTPTTAREEVNSWYVEWISVQRNYRRQARKTKGNSWNLPKDSIAGSSKGDHGGSQQCNARDTAIEEVTTKENQPGIDRGATGAEAGSIKSRARLNSS